MRRDLSAARYRTVVRQDIGDDRQPLSVVDQGRIIEGHDLHVIDHGLHVAEFRGDKTSLAPNRSLKTLAAFSIDAMTKRAVLRVDLFSGCDLRGVCPCAAVALIRAIDIKALWRAKTFIALR